jgi:uncharacterized membrane protein YfcA
LDADSSTLIIVLLIAFNISFFFSMLGLGGGQLYVPIFYWLGMDLKTEAIPPGLLFNFITQISAATTYLRNKLVDVVAARPLIITSLIFPFVGAYFTHLIQAQYIILIIGILLIFVACQTFFDWRPATKQLNKRHKILIGLLAGSVIGFIVGFLGRGGGSFIVPTLLIIGFMPKRAAATSSFVCTFSALTGFLAHANNGQINWELAFFGVIAALMGSQLGSRFMVQKISGGTLKIIFSIVLAIIGIELIIKELL